MHKAPTQEQLRDIFDYHESGNLVWKKGHPRVIGKFAGSHERNGYRRVNIFQITRALHRMIWIFWYGDIPAHLEIDHINCSRSDNRISNLRLVNKKENKRNMRGAQCNNKTGLLGVSKIKGGKFMAQFAGKYIGLYDTAEEASKAYWERKNGAST